MSPEPENFERLRKLMALKRHEQPPPGYFNNFSSEVIARIKSGAQGTRDFTDVLAPVPWLLRLFSTLEAKPLFAGAFGMAVCALLISGIVYSEQVQPGQDMNLAVPVFSGGSLASAAGTEDPLSGRIETPSPDPIAETAQSLFEQIQIKSTTPANYYTPGNYAIPAAGLNTNGPFLK